jgi:hypothetical protein
MSELNPFLQGDSSLRSLNRARIVALPGLTVEEGIIGQSGYDLVSAQALRQEVARWATELNLDQTTPDLLAQFETCFDHPDTQALARQIARAYGRKLGFLLLMLKRGDPENRAARPEWNEAHWQFWQTISTIIVGGGRLAGQLGRYAVPVAQEVLAQHGLAEVTITRSPYPAHLPLVGLARAAPPQTPAMLLFDFGHTSIKRAIARYNQDRVIALHVLPAIPTVCPEPSVTDRSIDQVQQQWQRMLALIEDTWRQVVPRWGCIRNLGISLACYLLEGHPSPSDRGCYGSLQVLSPHLATFMQQQVRERLREEVQVSVAHDGTAAALAYAGQAHSIVLTLGTAIGNGFPPPAEGYRPLAAEFQVEQHSRQQE